MRHAGGLAREERVAGAEKKNTGNSGGADEGLVREEGRRRWGGVGGGRARSARRSRARRWWRYVLPLTVGARIRPARRGVRVWQLVCAVCGSGGPLGSGVGGRWERGEQMVQCGCGEGNDVIDDEKC